MIKEYSFARCRAALFLIWAADFALALSQTSNILPARLAALGVVAVGGDAMNKVRVTIALLSGIFALVGMAYAQHADHQVTTPADLKWAPLPGIEGVQIAVIEGPMD